MNNAFPIIFNHFLLRTFREPMAIFFTLLLPMGLIILNATITLNNADLVADPAIAVTGITVLFMLAFQFFSGEVLCYTIYDDIRGTVRWRLLATPVPQRTFFIGAVLASWVFSAVQGLLTIGITSLIFDMQWGNPVVLVATLLLISLISQLIVITISQFASTRRLCSGIMFGIGFLMMFLSNALFVNLGNSAVMVFFRTYGTPLALGQRAILLSGVFETDMSEVMISLGILVAIAVVLAGISLVLGRRRKSA